ncbi:MAG TPA: M23 family metallopeptidase [Nitrospirae bacterium]|nr:M23 family metallopeptidase [Nitrospirota bacterium]
MLAIAIIFLASLQSYALNIEIIPAEVIPGDVFLIKVQTDEPDPVMAEFLGNKINLYPLNNGYSIVLVPVDINTQPKKYAVIIKQGEKEQQVLIKVKPYKFKTTELTLPKDKVTLSPENGKRAVREAELLKGIWPQNTSKTWNGRFITPTGTEVSTVFGVIRIMNGKKTSAHRGIDFRGKTGAPVRAINSGIVVLADNLFFGGNTLVINHGMGLYSVYMHLSKFNVSKGDKVSKEQIVGLIGSSGRVTGPHLHMSVKLNGVSVNPASLFRLKF